MPLIFPEFDPVAFHIFSLPIRWYALAYMASFIIGLNIFKRLCPLAPTASTTRQADDFLAWGIFGVIVGGRLGYVCFYDPMFFLSHPLSIFEVWKGGMSFHGGECGMLTAIGLFCHKYDLKYFRFSDRIAVVVPIGLFFGRCANFINGELWGRPVESNIPWAMVYPHVDMLPRHPSEIYEALAEGVILFTVLITCVLNPYLRSKRGFISGLFLSGYATARIICEFFREPDLNLGYFFGSCTMGQILSIPMLIVGIIFMVLSFRKTPVMGLGGDS